MADVIITLNLDNKEVSSTLKDTEKKAKKSGKNAGEGFSVAFSSQTKKSLLGLKALAVSVGAVVAGAFSVKKIIEAASAQEDAVNQLNTALRISGKYSEQASKDFQSYASSLQETSKFGDEVILQNAALIQSLGDLSQNALKDATKAALDMSAALGIDLTSAATLVGKAAAGEIGSFSRYGVIIKKGADNAETFSNALTALNSKFGGAAAAQVNTYSGASAQLSNTFGDLLEKLGDLFVKNEILVSVIKGVNKAFLLMQSFIENNKDSLKSFVSEGILSVVNGIGWLVDGFLTLGKTFFEIQGWISNLSNSFDIFINETLQSSVNLISKIPIIGEKFQEVNQALIENNKIKNEQMNLDDETAMLEKVSMIESMQEQLKASLEAINEASNESNQALFDNLSSNLDQNKEKIADTTATLSNIVKEFGTQWDAVAKSNTKTSVQMAKEISTSLQQGLGKGVANAFVSFGAALANGEDAMKAFAQSMLGMIGDIAIQIGTSFIAQGIAHSLNPLTPGIGGPLIGAGAALATLGGAIKALSGGKGGVGTTSTPVSGGGVASTPDLVAPQNDVVAQQDIEERKPDTKIAVNIQGDVLDSEESGLRILDILNSAFDKQSVIISNNARFA